MLGLCGICGIFGLVLGDVGESRPWRQQERDLSLHRKRLVPLHRSLAGAWRLAQERPFLLHSSSRRCRRR